MSSYYTLMTSLPKLSGNFKVSHLPISQLQLMKRTKLVPDHDKEIVKLLINLTWRDWFNTETDIKNDRIMTAKMNELHNPFIDELITYVFDIRSILAAIRLRKSNSDSTDNKQTVLLTHWRERILNHWNEPDFGLGSVYPWLSDVIAKQSSNESQLIDEMVITQLWKHLQSIETLHYFDLEALIIYLVRWQIINYWSQFDGEKAFTEIDKQANKQLESQLLNQKITALITGKDGNHETK